MFSFGLFFKPISEEFGWTRAVVSGAYSLNGGLFGFLAIIAGRLVDRFGPRLIVTVGCIVSAVSYLLMSQVSAVWQLYLFSGLLMSIGNAAIWVPVLSTVARWFVKGRGLVSGIVVSGAGAGILLMPLLISPLIARYDWRVTYLVLGLLVLVPSVIAAQFLRRAPPQANPVHNAGGKRLETLDATLRGLRAGEAVRTRQFWIISAVFFSFNFTVQVIMIHIVPHVTDINISAAAAAGVLAAAGGISIIGRIGLGSASDRLGNRRVIAFILAVMAIAFLWLLFARQLWMFYLFSVVFGLAYGGVFAVQSPTVAEFFGLKAHGVIFGLVSLGMSAGGAAGPLIAGYVFDTTGTYRLVFIICLALSAAGAILAMSLKPTRS